MCSSDLHQRESSVRVGQHHVERQAVVAGGQRDLVAGAQLKRTFEEMQGVLPAGDHPGALGLVFEHAMSVEIEPDPLDDSDAGTVARGDRLDAALLGREG